MNFDFSPEQQQLRDQLRRFLREQSPRSVAREVLEHGLSHSEAVWQGLVQIGATGVMLPESAGGAGLGALELCVLAEELGRQLCPVPIASTLYLATQVLLLAGTPAQQQRWLEPVSRGAIGALAAPLDGGLRPDTLPHWDGLCLHGTVDIVPDGMAAQWAVVLARSPSAGAEESPLRWIVCDLAQGLDKTLERRALQTLDGSKPCAAWRFIGTPGECLQAGSAEALLSRVRNRAAVLLAFEQIGAADAALEMAAAYAGERRAFGRSIGSYQGIKHKLVDVYNANQLARVHAYHGAWALVQDTRPAASAEAFGELATSAAAARVAASAAATQAAHEGLHVHGGMGCTWELDCHLFMRRARQQAVLLGHEFAWREQLAARLVARLDADASATGSAGHSHAGQAPGMAADALSANAGAEAEPMDFADSGPEAAFRAEARAWLHANAAPKQRADALFGAEMNPEQRMQAARDWQARKAAAGYGAITWPQRLGGRGGSAVQELIWREEEARFDVPTGLFNVSLGMVMPAVLAHGSDTVRAAHIAPALRGDHLWCQLLSEPGAGSDLGMLRTRAQRAADPAGGPEGWRLSGQKVWTSLAQFAQYGLVLARTDASRPKYEGLSCFFIDMRSPGVSVRPIRQIQGEAEFNEVFLDEVFVPDSQRIGAVGAGWKVTLTGLMSERLAIGGVMPAELWRTLAQQLRDTPFGAGNALQDGRFRERLAELYLASQGLWLLQCRALTALGQGREPGPEMSGAKNLVAHTLQAFTRLAIDLQGPQGLLSARERGPAHALIERLWFGAAGMRIAGGTDEIVKNSIGERVLGLEPEPRTDKGVPFDQLVR